MVRVFILALLFAAGQGHAQVTIDSTHTTITIHEKQAGRQRTLSVYRSYVPGKGMREQAVYQPTADEVGQEPETLHLDFGEESVHIKQLLDIALSKRKINLSRFAFNIALYSDLVTKLVDIYSSSPEWKAYLQQAGDLKVTVMLDDGSQFSEVAYDPKVAASVLDKSDFMKRINTFFAPYGYKAMPGGFGTDHQAVVSVDQLMLMGRNGNLVVPIPNPYFNLEKIK